MNRRARLGALLAPVLPLVWTSSALADHGLLEGEINLSSGSVLLALITSFVTGVVCYALMVWDPTSARK